MTDDKFGFDDLENTKKFVSELNNLQQLNLQEAVWQALNKPSERVVAGPMVRCVHPGHWELDMPNYTQDFFEVTDV